MILEICYTPRESQDVICSRKTVKQIFSCKWSAAKYYGRVHGFQSAYQYEVLDIRNPALFYTLSEEIYEARLLNFSSAWYVNNFRPTVPGLSQQDTSVKASDRRKWIFLNKQTRGEASQVRNSSFSSTIIRPSFGCKLSRFLLHATQTKASSRI